MGEEHPDVATNYNHLAGLYLSQGRYSKAKPLYKTAFSLLQRLLGEEHPLTAALVYLGCIARVERIGGQLTIATQPGRGTEIVVQLPIAEG